MNKPLETFVIEPKDVAKSAVIWLHGLGADAHDFVPIVSAMKLPDTLGLRVVFPNAPARQITINNGLMMRAWFDIKHMPELLKEEDLAGFNATQQQIQELIQQQMDQGIPASRILLAGFSQGAAMVLDSGLRYAQSLAGIIALSGWLPRPDTWSANATEANRKTPIFWGHGEQDPVVLPKLAQNSLRQLREAHYAVDEHWYPVAHGVHPQEVADLAAFIQQVLA